MTATATVSLDQATQTFWDVIVIGAGPAGGIAAQQLARRGCRVLVVEAKAIPRPKVCGGCLNQRALALLEECGLGAMAIEEGAVPLRELELWAGGRRPRFRLPGGVSLTRSVLDGRLLQSAISSGAEFIDHASAKVCETIEHDARLVEVQQSNLRKIVKARIVIAADGLARRSVGHLAALDIRRGTASRIGIGAVISVDCLSPSFSSLVPPGRVVMLVGREGYVGITWAEHGQISVGAAMKPAAIQNAGSIGEAVERLARFAGFFEFTRMHEIAWHGTPPLNSHPGRRSAERLFLVGDAAGYVEPFTGEGIAWAIEGALELAPIALRGVARWSPDLSTAWELTYRRQLGRSQWMCQGLAGILRHPRASSFAARLAGHFPRIAQYAISFVNRPLDSRSSKGLA